MKDCSSTLASQHEIPDGRSGTCYRRIVLFSLLLCIGNYPAFAASMDATVRDCTEIVRELSHATESSVPSSVLQSAKGVAILRVLKGGLFVSVRMGEGVVIARLPDRGWSAPSAVGTGGAGFGLQVGGQVTDLVVILNTWNAVEAFATGNVKLSGALSVAAGPIGHTAEVGVLPAAAVYIYSRSQGLFAGMSLEGTTLFTQTDKNASYYRSTVTQEQILSGSVTPPSSAKKLLAALGP